MPDSTPPTSTPPRSTPPSADPSSFTARASAAAAAASRAANAAIASVSASLAAAKANREAKQAAARSRSAVTGTRPDPAGPRPASVVVKAPVTPEQRERGRAVGLAAVGCASLIALVVTVGIFLPALGALTSGSAIRPVDAASLPGAILVCDRDYERTDAVLDSIVQVRARDGKDPTVVGVSNSCPAGVCMTEGVCLTVVYVATTDDRYAQYELQGGP
jgi:hypothetical protein